MRSVPEAEVDTLAVAQAMMSVASVREFLALAYRCLSHLFPSCPLRRGVGSAGRHGSTCLFPRPAPCPAILAGSAEGRRTRCMLGRHLPIRVSITRVASAAAMATLARPRNGAVHGGVELNENVARRALQTAGKLIPCRLCPGHEPWSRASAPFRIDQDGHFRPDSGPGIEPIARSYARWCARASCTWDRAGAGDRRDQAAHRRPGISRPCYLTEQPRRPAG